MSVERDQKDQYPLFFNAQEIGQSLHEVAADILQVEGRDILSRWYHSPKDADIFIWLDEKQNIIKQQVSFCGQVVEWNVVEGLKTGYVLEDETQGKGHEGGEVIHFDDQIQEASLEQAVALVEHALALPQEDRELLVKNYRNPKPLEALSSEEFLRRFRGLPSQTPPFKKIRKGLWARIRWWLGL